MFIENDINKQLPTLSTSYSAYFRCFQSDPKKKFFSTRIMKK